MFSKHDFPILGERLYPTLAHPHTPKVAAALAVAVLGAGVIVSIGSTTSPSAVSPAQHKSAAIESACEKQAWPYVGHRCSDSAAAQERGTRQVRVVNHRGEMATMTMPLPIVEQKRPAPAQTVAKADPPIGPEVIPAAPAPEQASAAAPERRPSAEALRAMAKAPAADVDAPAKKSKAAGKPSDKLAAKERKATDKAVPGDVIAAVEKAARRDRGGRVSPDVIAAVESATGGVVYDSAPVQRIYIVAP